jgi:hypothetical protein
MRFERQQARVPPRRAGPIAVCSALFVLAAQLLFVRSSGAEEGQGVPGASIYWGATTNSASYGQGLAPWEMTSVRTFSSNAGKPVSLVQWGMDWYNSSSWPAGHAVPGYPDGYYPFVPHIMDNVRQYGAIPMLSWFPDDGDQRGTRVQSMFSLSSIIEGRHDGYIRKWAADARDWAYPFFLRFAHEMNGDWYPWSEQANGNAAGQFVLAWRHVHDIFSQVGAANVTWVWCPNVEDRGLYQISQDLYPGDDYVDWTCLDGYNWGNSDGGNGRLQSFDEIYRTSYDKITAVIAPTKPMVIAEVASHDAPGDKAAWITDMLTRQLPDAYPRAKGFLWYNVDDFSDGSGRSARFMIEDSAHTQTSFADAIASSDYATNAFGALPEFRKIQPIDAGS